MWRSLRDHCRIGSLEKNLYNSIVYERDHCRIGSLENLEDVVAVRLGDHCRIGSLENNVPPYTLYSPRSLPHRQLRNTMDQKTNPT